MIYRDPLANPKPRMYPERWFAWFPVQLDRENRTAWLQYVYRDWIEAAGWGCHIYASKPELLDSYEKEAQA